MQTEPSLVELLQRRKDLTFLGLLCAVLATMGIVVVSTAYPPHRDIRTTSGEIRAVDPGVLKRQLRSGRLSDREAEHYRRGSRGGTP